MNDEIAKLQLQLDHLNEQFRNAQRTIRKLEHRSTWRRPNAVLLIVLVGAVALSVSLWSAKASSHVYHALYPSDTTPTKLKAPFEVDDDNGIPIMVVRDQGGDANIGRGVYVIDQSRKAVVRLGTTDDDGGGGMIMVTETGPMTTSTGSQVNGVEIIGAKEKSTVQVIRDAKKIVSMGGEQEDKGGSESGGSVQVFGTNEKSAGALSATKTGGELKIYDAKNKQAAKLGGDSVGGSLNIYGAGDKPKVAVSVDSDGGTISIYGTGDKAIATLKSNAGDGKLSIADKEGNPVVEAVANQTGGYVKVMKDGDDKTYTSINSFAAGNGLKVRKAGVDTVFVGEGSEGGTIENYNAAGDMVGSLGTIGGKGLIAVFSGKHAVAFMTESDKHPGGGNVTTTNPAGEGIFSAGFTGEGGDACINRKTGLKCLGIGLPLQINP